MPDVKRSPGSAPSAPHRPTGRQLARASFFARATALVVPPRAAGAPRTRARPSRCRARRDGSPGGLAHKPRALTKIVARDKARHAARARPPPAGAGAQADPSSGGYPAQTPHPPHASTAARRVGRRRYWDNFGTTRVSQRAHLAPAPHSRLLFRSRSAGDVGHRRGAASAVPAHNRCARRPRVRTRRVHRLRAPRQRRDPAAVGHRRTRVRATRPPGRGAGRRATGTPLNNPSPAAGAPPATSRRSSTTSARRACARAAPACARTAARA